MKELFNDPKEDEYLSEFRQKIAQEIEEDIEQRKRELERSRNGFIGTLAGIVLAGLVSWFLLLPKFGFNNEEEIPVIRRPLTPVKIQPSEPGGMDIENQDKTVYALVEKNDEIDTKVESLLPPPEAPKMPTIVVQEEPAKEEILQENDAAQENLDSMDDLISAVETTATEKVKIPEKLPVIDVAVKTAPADVKTQDEKTIVQEIPVKIEPKAIETVIKAPEKTMSLSGRYKVQMMASTNKEAVEKAYRTLEAKYPVIKGLPYVVESGKDSMYRLKVGAFEMKKDAENLCAEVKKAGGSCMVKE